MSCRMSRRVIGLLVICLLPGALLAADGDDARKRFPKHGEVEYEHSIITIPIFLPGDTSVAEVLKLDAFMRLVREPSIRNGLGYGQFEFVIDAWELYGYSKVLDAYITFKLSDTVKPKSLGVALQKNSDYPAMIVYNAIYDVYLDDVKVGENMAGVAFATGVMEIPPRNITVAFHKPFGFKRLAVSRARPDIGRIGERGSTKFHRPECSESQCECQPDELFCADGGSCEDMESISSAQFEAGASKAKSYRVNRQARLKNGGAPSPGASATPKKKSD
jgi:hypothetical protein